MKEFQDGYLAYHGKRDTYNLARANIFEWENKGKSAGDDGDSIKNNYDNMYKYWCGLIQLRKSEIGEVFRIANKPATNYYEWLEPENTRLLGYFVDNTVCVLVNTDTVSGEFNNLLFPGDRSWKLIADIEKIDLTNGIQNYEFSMIEGGKKHNITLDPESIFIWIND